MSINLVPIVEAAYNYYNEFPCVKLLLKYEFTPSGSYKFFVRYVSESDEEVPTEIDSDPIDNELDKIADYFEAVMYTEEKFNRFIIEIGSDKTYSHRQYWDFEKEKQDWLNTAEVFYQWVNQVMMSMIFEYEKDNGFLQVQYDSDGDLEYLSSWDSGIFTFHISSKKEIEYSIVLTLDGKERILDMPLKDYFTEGILEHHKVTNIELADEWESWNTMILKSLHYDIPYDKREEFVRYF
ncbi:hypothetical protein SAMN02927916_3932 [Flavobacterium anhuiense]|uniref:Uncharacterized protein n=1 Tax=Flavobacterium anhuiense TaxID=459526 RepID=A0ABY0M1B1_9FLAO|nr:hypothetical protein [Flavobacterium anhuiense]SCY90413.1 hypothetical protein SAMN02927916_3932 [Flavobacterium anhuiense]